MMIWPMLSAPRCPGRRTARTSAFVPDAALPDADAAGAGRAGPVWPGPGGPGSSGAEPLGQVRLNGTLETGAATCWGVPPGGGYVGAVAGKPESAGAALPDTRRGYPSAWFTGLLPQDP
jgi:hypothetical protein